VETGALSRREGRKCQTQALLLTRPTDEFGFDSPTAGDSFFPVPVVIRAHLGHTRPFSPAIATTSLRRLAICRCGRRHSRLSTVGGETTTPAFLTSTCRAAQCRAETVLILPFPPPFSRARQVGDISCALAAQRSSAFPPRGTLRVSGPSQKDWPSFALAAQ
jgi:hypothetical protein